MDSARYTAFVGDRRIAQGTACDVALALKQAYEGGETRVVALDDETGRPVDFDLRGGPAEIAARYAGTPRRGRPKLGVVAREVTLLPRHWDWLAARPGGASAALRRLVQAAMSNPDGPEALRRRREARYRAMSALAGDLPGFEDASRALFAGDEAKLVQIAAAWPKDVQAYLVEPWGVAPHSQNDRN